MDFKKITQAEIEANQVASLPDRMSGTAAENKAAFDALAKLAIERYNELIDILTSGAGADNVGSEPFAGVGEANTVRGQLLALQGNIADAVAGSIPDASITAAKLADNVVSNAKLQNGAVTEAKIGDGEVTGAKLRDLAVETSKLADGAVTAAKMADGAVTVRTLTEEAIARAQEGTPKMQTGSYQGTGKDITMSLTFDFVPTFVFIHAFTTSVGNMMTNGGGVFEFAIDSLTTEFRNYGYKYKYGNANQNAQARFEGNTLYWRYNTTGNSDGGMIANYGTFGEYFWYAFR